MRTPTKRTPPILGNSQMVLRSKPRKPEMSNLELVRKRILQKSTFVNSYSIQRVQVPKTQGIWSQEPYPEWFWKQKSLIIGYLDPVGYASLNASLSSSLTRSTRLGVDRPLWNYLLMTALKPVCMFVLFKGFPMGP